jgi:O-methyltransferase
MSFLTTCQAQTMTCKEHLLFLDATLKKMNETNLPGAIVECGVWKGGCCMWMAHCQKRYATVDRAIYLFDTFNGMTMPIDYDAKEDPRAMELYNKITNGRYQRHYDKWHHEKKWAYAPLEYVQQNVDKVGYNPEFIHYVVGDVLETLRDQNNLPAEIAILRLDTDWYASTKTELEVLFPRVVKGGLVIIDDYFAWRGSRNATDEFLTAHGQEVHLLDVKRTGNIFAFVKL